MKRGAYEKRVPYAVRVKKKTLKKPVRTCLTCQRKMPHAHGNALYCGNARKKTGCAHKRKMQRDNEWKTRVHYSQRPQRREYMKQFN